MSENVAALFVDPKGPYFGRTDVDAWDEARDARLYKGPLPVVAHPPCSVWSCLAPVNEARYGHKVGDDGGCFASALASVRAWGGVLEHPAGTRAWAAFGLPKPVPLTGWTRTLFDPGWVCEVSQRAYGHRAQKATWLYYVGSTKPADLNWTWPEPVATVSFLTNHGGGSLPRLSKREAKATPPEFMEALLSLARESRWSVEGVPRSAGRCAGVVRPEGRQ